MARFPWRFRQGDLPGLEELGQLVDRFNLRRVYYWVLLASLVGVVGGLGALAFKWLADQVLTLFWPTIVSFVPASAGGEPIDAKAAGPLRVWGLVVAPAIGGLLSALLVFRFAPEAAGHGTDAAIRAYHRQGGRIRWQVPLVKLVASSLTIGSGGSAGREGPIAQIGAGFGSLLGTVLRLSERERGVLLMAGVSAGIGAIFRAPFAGAIFAAEVLYREPDLEAEVLVPALLSSIVSYSIYCSVHGFGHLLTGTSGFTFSEPSALLCYAALGGAVAFGGIAYVTLLERTTRAFRAWKISNYAKPALGGALVGTIGAIAYLVSRDDSVLSVMGSGYGTLQNAVSESGALGPSLAILAFVAAGKIVTTSVTIGSGGSGGVFGPSMVIGGCIGACAGTVFHAWFPQLVPDVGPFTIVGMAGFFAGVAKAPISTLLMVGELTGNYTLLIPSMLVVCISMIVTHRWTIYPEQVRTRAESPVHRSEMIKDVLAGLSVADVVDRETRPRSVPPSMMLRDVVKVLEESEQRTILVVGEDGRLHGVLDSEIARNVLAADPIRGLVVAADLLTPNLPIMRAEESVQRALELLSLDHVDTLPVVSEEGALLGLLDHRSILNAYRLRAEHLRRPSAATMDTRSDR